MGIPPVEAALRRIVETSSFLLVIVDAEMHITWASPVCFDLLGYTPDEMVGLGVDLLHPDDLVARLGGDEFAVLCAGADGEAADEATVATIAERLVTHLGEPMMVAGTLVSVAASVGVAFGGRGLSSDELLERADTAQRTAKREGKGRWRMAR